MGKTSASRKALPKKDAAPRKAHRSREDIEANRQALLSLAGDLLLILKEMAANDLDGVLVDGVQKFPRGMKALRQYRAAVSTGIEKAKAEKS